MFCLGCEYPLDGLEAHRCPECGRAFDPADENSFALKPLFTTRSSIEAEMLRDMLEDEGIEASIHGASAGGAVTGPPVVVRVRGPDCQRAMIVLTSSRSFFVKRPSRVQRSCSHFPYTYLHTLDTPTNHKKEM